MNNEEYCATFYKDYKATIEPATKEEIAIITGDVELENPVGYVNFREMSDNAKVMCSIAISLKKLAEK